MDTGEFEKQFNELYLPLGMYALRLLDDAFMAEDVVQTSFLNAWQAVRNGRPIENMKAYMYRAVHNECMSRLRSARESVPLDEIAEPTDDDVDTSERDAALWKAIDALPTRCREVFLLSKRDGMSQEEIARRMNISVKTVKNQMTKAYERLRGALSQHGGNAFFLPFL